MLREQKGFGRAVRVREMPERCSMWVDERASPARPSPGVDRLLSLSFQCYISLSRERENFSRSVNEGLCIRRATVYKFNSLSF